MTTDKTAHETGPLPERWYVVANDGMATLCANERDAIKSCAKYDKQWPRSSPHRAVLLGNVAAERERCARICEHPTEDEINRFCGLSPVWEVEHAAAAIRAL